MAKTPIANPPELGPEDMPSAEPTIALTEWAQQAIPVHGYEITMAFVRQYPEHTGRRTELDRAFVAFAQRPVA